MFLIVGYQVCLFVHHSSVLRIESLRDRPDTVYVTSYLPAPESVVECGASDSRLRANSAGGASGSRANSGVGQGAGSGTGSSVSGAGTSAWSSGGSGVPGRVRTDTVRHYAKHSEAVEKVRRQRRKVETFAFNPNTVSVEDLQRLGFSERQAQSIDHYRQKGGRFWRADDFGKSYVVADSVFARLRPYIRIPKVDINLADSAAFDALPGIGPYYAAQMVKYRQRLGGYSCTEQLMELYRFDEERFAKIADLVECRQPHRFDLWNADEAALAAHPAIRRRDTARSIILYRNTAAPPQRSISALHEAGIIDSLQAVMLSRCVKF